VGRNVVRERASGDGPVVASAVAASLWSFAEEPPPMSNQPRRRACAVFSLLLAGCGSAPDAVAPDAEPRVSTPDAAAADGATADAAAISPDADPSRCADLRYSATEGDITAATLAFVDAMRAHGATGAYFDAGPDGTQRQLAVWHLNVDLATSEADPAGIVVDWFASVPGSPIRADEYRAVVNEDRTRVVLFRDTIDGVPFRTSGAAGTPGWELPGLAASVETLPDGWRIQLAILQPVVLFATVEDAALQRDCTPDAPPSEAPVRAYTFTGIEMEACAPVGEYEYTPDERDAIAWLPEGVLWPGTVRTTSEPSERSVWLPRRRLELTIDPSNYWERIPYCDCLCHDGAGFTVVVHALTGEILDWWPGVRCVVC
jgi:hypothetical protein